MPAVVYPETVNDIANFRLDMPKTSSKFFLRIAFNIYEKIFIRSRLSEAQNHRCCWCNILTTEERNKKNSSTIEHYQCKCEGGSNHIDNLVMACHDCNQKRGTHTPEDFLNFIWKGIPLPGVKIDEVGYYDFNHAPLSWYNEDRHSRKRGIKARTRKIVHKLRYNPQVVWC